MSSTSTPERKNAPPELWNTTKTAKSTSKSWSVETVSASRARGEGKVSRSAPPELRKTTLIEGRGGKSALGTNFRRSGRGLNRSDLGGKKSGGLKKRSHSPSNREPGRSLKTRKSRSRVTSPEPIVSDTSDRSKSDKNRDMIMNKKKASQTQITEFYTIRKEKSTYKVIRTLPDDFSSDRGTRIRTGWEDDGKRMTSASAVTTRRTRHIPDE